MWYDWRWFNVIGLVADISGAVLITLGVLATKRPTLAVGVVTFASGGPDYENLPAVRDRLRQSRLAAWGLALLILGFTLQLIGSWPR